MSKRIIGIDPGSKGFACVYCDGAYSHVPLKDSQKDFGFGREFIALLRSLDKEDIVVIEKVMAIHGVGSTSTFNFGASWGMVLGALMCLGIPYELVTPKRWQNTMWNPTDRTGDTKSSSYNAARRLHPDMDFRRTEKCRNFDDNKVDATLICDYGRRLFSV